MHLTDSDKARLTGSYVAVREPNRPDVAAQSDPGVIATVSEMLSDIERDGLRGRSPVRRTPGRLDRR